MADLDYTSALGDLNFAPAENYYGIGAQSIAQALPSLTNPYASPLSNLGVTLGGALVASLLGYQARKEANDLTLQTQRYANQLLKAETPEARVSFLESLPSDVLESGVGTRLSRLSTALAQQQAVENAVIQRERNRIQALAPLEIDVARAKEMGVSLPELQQIDKQRAEIRGQSLAQKLAQATAATGGTAGTASIAGQIPSLAIDETSQVLSKAERAAVEAKRKLETEQRSEVDALRKEFSNLPEVKNYSLIDTAAKVVSQAVKDPSSVATQELVRRAVQLIEPGMAVREGEQAAIMASQSIPDRFRGELSRVLAGEGGLSDDTRAGIMRIAERAYRTQADKYKSTKDYYEGLAEERRLPKKAISYLGEPQDWSSLTATKQQTKQEQLQSILQQMQTTVDPIAIANLKKKAAEIYKAP